MSSEITSLVDGSIILWFVKFDRSNDRAIYVQVTLIDARLKFADLAMSGSIPAMMSYEIIEINEQSNKKMELRLQFDPGSLTIECSSMVFAEYCKTIKFEPTIER